MSGSSATPLTTKLGIGPGTAFATKHAPAGFAEVLGELPPEAEWRRQVRPKLGVVIAFYRRRAVFEREFDQLTRAVAPHGAVWIAWPKRASKAPTDLTEDVLRDVVLPTGWVDNKVCAIDDTWSGLRFALRRELR